jgi:hypothetical protein
MSLPQKSGPAKLVVSVLMNGKQFLDPLITRLSSKFGPIDMLSEWFPFDFTTYYEPEMGAPLIRRMLTFDTLIQQTALPEIKAFTNEIELDLATDHRRRVNIDPGYLLLERFVLATGKNFTHRIYLGEGIYADLTLLYQQGDFQSLPWTYPDYSAENMLVFLRKVRDKFKIDLRE